MVRLVLVLGDQLSDTLSALRACDPSRDLVVMAEVAAETAYVAHHPKKIAFFLAAMRKFAARLEADGWRVAYTRLDDPDNTGSIPAELMRRARQEGTDRVLVTQPGEWRLIAALDALPLAIETLPDTRFFCSGARFASWAKGRKTLRMEHFYREIRRQTGILMDGDKPAGGKWNFDHENRNPADQDLFRLQPPRFEPDAVTEAVLALVEQNFPNNFGLLRPFWLATDRAGALEALAHFIRHSLPDFGATQDAMLRGDKFLHHAVISAYLNAGLLTAPEVCHAAEEAYRAGAVPINSAEGFIRQILGWREFVRGVYFLEGPGYTRRNVLNHRRHLPAMYWGAATRMTCMAHALDQTRTDAYAHHIQRLMVTGNFALMAGIDPWQVHEWYLSVYADAVEWVEAPNTLGMSQFADGGVVGSKPYVSSGAYIDRMSDYCGSCHYRVKERSGARACPFNLLYWHFLDRHRARFETNPRMAQMYRTWDRMDPDHRRAVLSGGAALLDSLDRGAEI